MAALHFLAIYLVNFGKSSRRRCIGPFSSTHIWECRMQKNFLQVFHHEPSFAMQPHIPAYLYWSGINDLNLASPTQLAAPLLKTTSIFQKHIYGNMSKTQLNSDVCYLFMTAKHESFICHTSQRIGLVGCTGLLESNVVWAHYASQFTCNEGPCQSLEMTHGR